MVELGEEGVKRLRKQLKFGDAIVNYWASEDNPHRVGIFIRFEKLNRMDTLLLTKGKGDFWNTGFPKRSRIERVGSICPHFEPEKLTCLKK